MKTFLLVVLLSVVCCKGQAQIAVTRYFNNSNLTKEVPQEKAKFSVTVMQSVDKSETTFIKDLKTGEVISSTTYKGDEPFGKWIYWGRELDFDFNIDYSEEKTCSYIIGDDTVENVLKDDSLLHYKAPRLASGEADLYQYMIKHMLYPARARDNDVSGRVLTRFIITKEGIVKDITVRKGMDIELTKEAVRCIREMKFAAPAMLNGQPQDICVLFPLVFKLK